MLRPGPRVLLSWGDYIMYKSYVTLKFLFIHLYMGRFMSMKDQTSHFTKMKQYILSEDLQVDIASDRGQAIVKVNFKALVFAIAGEGIEV